MIVPIMAISNLVLTQQIYSEETNGAHAHYREPVPLRPNVLLKEFSFFFPSGFSSYILVSPFREHFGSSNDHARNVWQNLVCACLN